LGDSVYSAGMLSIKMECPNCWVKMQAEGTLTEIMDAVEKHIITEANVQAKGNRTQAAKDLGIEVYQLRHLQKKHGLIP
jgi:transcriptional regulator with PAS, ATPase and Fis domain